MNKIVKPEFISVDKNAFEEFLKNYPRKLDRHVSGICTPASISYNDWELAGAWPGSVVARTWDYDEEPYGIKTPEEERDYQIMSNFEEVFENRDNVAENERHSVMIPNSALISDNTDDLVATMERLHLEDGDLVIVKMNLRTQTLPSSKLKQIYDNIRKATKHDVLFIAKGNEIDTVSKESQKKILSDLNKEVKDEVIKTLMEWKENSDVVSIDSMIALIENRF